MPTKTADITLAFLAKSGVGELFDREVRRVAANMRDPNTSPTAPREIVLKLKIKPAKDRGSAELRAQTTCKLAPADPVEQRLYLGRRDGEIVAVAFDPGQHQMFDEDTDASVTPINRDRQGAEG